MQFNYFANSEREHHFPWGNVNETAQSTGVDRSHGNSKLLAPLVRGFEGVFNRLFQARCKLARTSVFGPRGAAPTTALFKL